MTQAEKFVNQCIMAVNTTEETMVGMLNQWEIDRGAEESEMIFDLWDVDDFKKVIDMYDLETAVKCYNDGRYYICGCNFKTPMYVRSVKALFDVHYPDIAYSVCSFPTAYTKWVNIDELMTEFLLYTNKTEESKAE